MDIKHLLLNNWHTLRILRFGIGIVITINAWQVANGWLAVAGVFLIFQALSNTGCCGSNGCDATSKTRTDLKEKEISFTEIK